jgi:hypothetical protein
LPCVSLESERWNSLLAQVVSAYEQHSTDAWQSTGMIAKIECSIFIALPRNILQGLFVKNHNRETTKYFPFLIVKTHEERNSMLLTVYEQVEPFLQRVRDELEGQEVRNCLLLGLRCACMSSPTV